MALHFISHTNPTTLIKKACFILASLLVALSHSQVSLAQNTGGVFSPSVNEGHKSFQYRVALEPENNSEETGFAQRFHYQQAIDGDFMWRLIGQTRKTPASDFDFDFVQAELFWELSDNEDTHKSGLRFDARLRDNNRPNQLGINWINHFTLKNGWSARGIILSSVQTGSNAADGVNIQTRAQLAKPLAQGRVFGFEMYNNYGNTGDMGNFNEQSHTIGPFLSAPLNKHYSIFAGALFGLSDGSPDTEFRIRITRGF